MCWSFSRWWNHWSPLQMKRFSRALCLLIKWRSVWPDWQNQLYPKQPNQLFPNQPNLLHKTAAIAEAIGPAPGVPVGGPWQGWSMLWTTTNTQMTSQTTPTQEVASWLVKSESQPPTPPPGFAEIVQSLQGNKPLSVIAGIPDKEANPSP